MKKNEIIISAFLIIAVSVFGACRVADGAGRTDKNTAYNIINEKKISETDSNSESTLKTTIKDVSNLKTGIKVKWEKVEGACGYEVWRDGKKIADIGENKTSYTDKKAKKNGKKYYYRIAVKTNANGKAVTGKLSAKRGQYFLKRTRFETIYMKGNSVSSAWILNSKSAGYEIVYSKNSNFSDSKTITIAGKNAVYKNFSLSNDSNYYFKIRNYRVTGTGEKKRTCYSAWSSVCMIINWDESKEFAGNSILHSDAVTLYRSYAKHRAKKTVCINAGHGTIGGNQVKTLCHPDGSKKVTGGSTAAGETKAAAVSSGTVLNNGLSEADANLNLAIVIKNKLLAAGFDVLMIREDKNVNTDNIARTVFANEYADYHISLHYDSSANDKGAFYIGVPQIESYLNMYPVSKTYKKHKSLGENVLKGMCEAGVKIYGNGCMALDLTQTSYSKIASIDIEVGDRASDTSKTTLKKIAEGILKGLKYEAGI